MKTLFKGLMIAVIGTFVWLNGELLMSKRLFLDEPRLHVVEKGEFLSQIAKRYYGEASYWRALALINRAPDANLIFPGETIMLPAAGPVAKLSRARSLTQVNEIVKNQGEYARIETEQERSEFAHVAASDEGGGMQAARLATEGGSGTKGAQPIRPAAEGEGGGAAYQRTAPADMVPEVGPANSGSGSPEAPDFAGKLPEVVAGQAPEPSPRAPVQESSGGWFWPITGGLALLSVGGYLFYRRRRNESEVIDASPLDDTPPFEKRIARSQREAGSEQEYTPFSEKKASSKAQKELV